MPCWSLLLFRSFKQMDELVKELHCRFQEIPSPLLGFEVGLWEFGLRWMIAFTQAVLRARRDVLIQSGKNIFKLLLQGFVVDEFSLVVADLFQRFLHVDEAARRQLVLPGDRE